MNIRIRILAEQAGLRFTKLASNPTFSFIDCKESELERFVELIVKDDIIQKHFGVKLR